MRVLFTFILSFCFLLPSLESQDLRLRLKDDGTFFVGNLPFTMFVQYRVPENFNGLSMVLMHGGGQTGNNFESTPDGRPGWVQFFLRKGFSVYNVDYPCMGRSGFVAECPTISGKNVVDAGVQLLDQIETPTVLLAWSTSGPFITGMANQRPQKVRALILVEAAEVGNALDQPVDTPGSPQRTNFTVRRGRPAPEDITAFSTFRRINEDVGTDGIADTNDLDGSEGNGILDTREDVNGNGLLDFPAAFFTREPSYPLPPANIQMAKGYTPTMPGITNERGNYPSLGLCDQDQNGVISDTEVLGPHGDGSHGCCDINSDGEVTRGEIIACGSQIDIQEPITFRDTTKVLSIVSGTVPPDPEGPEADQLTSLEVERARAYYAEFPFPQYNLSFVPFERIENSHRYFRRQNVDATLFYLRDTIQFPFPRRNPANNPDSIENLEMHIYSTSLGFRIGNGHALMWGRDSEEIAGLIYDWIESRVIQDKAFRPPLSR